MKRNTLTPIAVALAIAAFNSQANAQAMPPKLHINTRWKECSFQLDPSLTQSAWRQFTDEAGLVVYFRPLADARPMGRGKFEVSAVQWSTGIDDADAAWNDTFVHPDSAHELFKGSRLQFPGLVVRAGLTEKIDVGMYVTKAVGANYGFYGAQVQHALLGGGASPWTTSARASFVSMYGPDDVDLTVYGAEVIASRQVKLTTWASVSPYAGVSGYLASSHERSSVVNLSDEHVPGARATIGTALQLSKARIGVEYSFARVNSLSIKAGIGL